MDKRVILQKIVSEISETLTEINLSSIEGCVEDILSADRIFIAGAGRTLLMMRAFAMSLMQIGLKSNVVGETTTPAITNADLLLAASYSGKTKSTMLFVREASRIGAKVILITPHPESPIGQLADRIIVINSPSDDVNKGCSIQFEGNGFEHALVPFGDALIMFLCECTGADENFMLQNHANLE